MLHNLLKLKIGPGEQDSNANGNLIRQNIVVLCACVLLKGQSVDCLSLDSHLWGFRLVLPIEKLWQRSSLNFMDTKRKGNEYKPFRHDLKTAI